MDNSQIERTKISVLGKLNVLKSVENTVSPLEVLWFFLPFWGRKKDLFFMGISALNGSM